MDTEDDSDPVAAAAFKGAFERLRYVYGFTAYYKGYGKETERLGDLIFQVFIRAHSNI
jgi:hypothetical protein